LFSDAEADQDNELRSLRSRIAAEMNVSGTGAVEFRDEEAIALGLRLIRVEIKPPGPQWRLTLPPIVAAVMQIRPGESEVAALWIEEHIEFWTIETLRSAMTRPIAQIT